MQTYRALPDNLKETADAAQKYLTQSLGLTSIKVESEVYPALEFRPTFHAITTDKNYVCVEVVDQLFAADIQRVILEGRNLGLPIKLYVVVAKGQFSAYEPRVLKFAKDNGIAILEVNPPHHGVLLTTQPVPLSLAGLRTFDVSLYPMKYRTQLHQAIETFKTGNPSKGCSDVYDELEQLTRRLGVKCQNTPNAFKKVVAINWIKTPWAICLEELRDNINCAAIKCPDLTKQLFSRLIGMTEFRNQSGHKPTSTLKTIERDYQLRTRFESAMDGLGSLIEATKPLRI